ncbi:hydroxyacid dehydrogenase [Candidatus Micrarchaeota archaeon]|nr:hydroxyacid dehydrogenase [Candidatus Micrarchaeota archaeon]
MNRIAFFDLEPWEGTYIKRHLHGFKTDCFTEGLDEKNVVKARNADAVGVFIYSPITEKILQKLPKAKLVVTLSTGYDHIDLAACRKRDVTVCNVPEYGSNTVAEHTFALLLALSRRIPASTERTKKGDFRLQDLRGFDLAGKTIGIVGLGRIGQHVARIAQGFDMKILAYDVNGPAIPGVKRVPLKTLLQQSDVVTLHCPLNGKTRHLLNGKTLQWLKKGAVVLNTARGGLIETEALLKALYEKRVSAAALDVLEEEGSIREEKQLLHEAALKASDFKTALQQHALLAQDNVIVTPHNAFNSQEALQRILDTTADNVKAYFAGKPKNIVK